MKNKQKRSSKGSIKIKRHGLYFVSNKDLDIRKPNGNIINGGHVVILTNIDKKRKSALVKPITSVNHFETSKNRWSYSQKTLEKVMNGDALVVSRKDLKSKHLSAVVHDKKKVKVSALKPNYSTMRFPTRYAALIDRK